ELQKQGTVLAIDLSPKAVETCKLRGVANAMVADVWEMRGPTFDTILMLMNGTGIFGTMDFLNAGLQHLRLLLNPGAQILIDSSDLIYMFDDAADGSKLVPATGRYYGELEFVISYKGEVEEAFPWL